jgi:MHS family proline/betaine transporter-like MFS transporter
MHQHIAFPADSACSKRTVMAGMIGNVMEWYDFALFGFMAPILSPLFFPASDRVASLLATYGVFAIGFLMRPLGGIFFGHIGDRLGRKKALLWSVLLMALPTTLLGLLPTYAQVGLLAPLLLTLIRMLQGLSVGGEFVGSTTFLGEKAPANRRGYFTTWSTTSATFGNLLGSAMAALVQWGVPPADVPVWGWRIPFLCSVLMGLFGLWLRNGMTESAEFKKISAAGKVARVPLLVTLRENRKALAITVGLTFMGSIGFYLPWVWLPTWMSQMIPHPLPLSKTMTINTLSLLVLLVLLQPFGALSDRVGRRPLMILGCLLLAILTYPLFLLLSQGNEWSSLCAMILMALLAAMIVGASSAAYVELFPTETRFSGIALGYNGTLAVFGGTTPFVATWLVHATGHVLAAAWYFLAAVVICGLTALYMQESAGQELD